MEHTKVTEEQLEKIAHKIGASLKIGDVIILKGDLGVGKTTFTKYLVRSLSEVDVDVTSPTFNLVYIYNTKKFDIWHFDLYRLEKTSDIYELGIEDALDFGVSIIEWPDIAESFLPKNRIEISLSYDKDNQDQRMVKITHNK